MALQQSNVNLVSTVSAAHQFQGGLFRRYLGLFVALVSVALIGNGIIEIWFSYQEDRVLLVRIQAEQAEAAAAKIGAFIKEVESKVEWTTQLPFTPGDLAERQVEAARLFRQTPALMQLAQIDQTGREQLRVS